MVTIQNVSKIYTTDVRQVVAVEDVSLTIRDGEFVCVVGHSGCGKTTLLNILGKFMPPTSGRIEIDGASLEDSRTNIGIVFQEYALFPWCTALGNVTFGLKSLKLGRAETKERALEYLRLVNLEDFAEVYPHQLSGGMRQRVAVARALAYDPDLLLMDEPFGALDAQTRERLQALTERVWQGTAKTVFYVTHNLAEAVYLAERIVVMRPNPGRIHEVVPVDLPRPRDPLSADFVAIQKYLTDMIMHDRPKEVA
jgi:NitT/TauT family transport system ATP-binding protein